MATQQPINSRCMTIGTDYSASGATGKYTDYSGYIALAPVIIVKTGKGQIPYQPDIGGNLPTLMGQPVTEIAEVNNDMGIQLEERLPSFIKLSRITPGVDSSEPYKGNSVIQLKNLYTNDTYEVETNG